MGRETSGAALDPVLPGFPVLIDGCDIADFPLPEGVAFMDWAQALESAWDVVAMFDVLANYGRDHPDEWLGGGQASAQYQQLVAAFGKNDLGAVSALADQRRGCA